MLKETLEKVVEFILENNLEDLIETMFKQKIYTVINKLQKRYLNEEDIQNLEEAFKDIIFDKNSRTRHK